MSEQNEIQLAHKLLEQHYGEPVMPVSKYCEKIEQWLDVQKEFKVPIGFVNYRKSNLLHRLLYLDEDMRTTPCPIHKGKWSGWALTGQACDFCMSGPNITGWVRPGIKVLYHSGDHYEVFLDE